MISSNDADAHRYIIGEHAYEAPRIEPGLYVVATPIGNLGDITLRALETLAAADIIACEDTRVTATLLQRFALKAPLFAYHEHNAEKQRPKLMQALAEGKIVAQVSDAGTPIVSDPGFRLVRDAVAEGHKVVPIPGASAPLTALVGSGMASDTFLFAGFLPQKGGPRQRRLEELRPVPATLIFFESPHRVAATLAQMAEVFGDRQAVVARELTKRFETFKHGSLTELSAFYEATPTKGEIVILVSPPEAQPEENAENAEELLREALKTMPAAAAAKQISKQTGLNRKEVYQMALDMKSAEE